MTSFEQVIVILRERQAEFLSQLERPLSMSKVDDPNDFILRVVVPTVANSNQDVQVGLAESDGNDDFTEPVIVTAKPTEG